MISTIITAGGLSSRFGENKLLVKIGSMSVIEHTISKFLNVSDEIIIPTTKSTRDFIESSSVYYREKITFAPFGKTRQESVYNALCLCKYNDYVLIHDGARPFIEQSDILKIIEEVKEKNAVCSGVFAIDTIKITNEKGIIEKTIDRKKVFQAQTPQAFYYDLIMEAHKKFRGSDSFTDDSSMIEALGESVYIFENTAGNKKITTPADL